MDCDLGKQKLNGDLRRRLRRDDTSIAQNLLSICFLRNSSFGLKKFEFCISSSFRQQVIQSGPLIAASLPR